MGRPAGWQIVLADRLALAAGVLARLEAEAARGTTVLMYHKVLPLLRFGEYPLQNLVVTRELFERQMAWLARNRRILPLGEAIAPDRPPGPPVVSVTFDDGYRDNFEFAVPVMERFGIRGTFYVTTGFVEGEPLWVDRAILDWIRLPREKLVGIALAAAPAERRIDGVRSLTAWLGYLKRTHPETRGVLLDAIRREIGAPEIPEAFAPLTPEQIRIMADRGHEIGSHTVSHPLLPQSDSETLAYELARSKDVVEHWTGRPVPGLCYPNGDYDDRVVEAAARTGYSYACTTRTGSNLTLSRFGIERRMVTSQNSSGIGGRFDPVVFRSTIAGLHDRMRIARLRLRTAAPGP